MRLEAGDKGTTAKTRYRRSKTQEFGLTLPSPIVDDVIGRTKPRRSQQCMATGDVFVASTGKNRCDGDVDGCWNVALRTPMKRGGVRRVHLAGAEEHSQARADSSERIQSVARDPAAGGQGHATQSAGTLGGCFADFIAVLDSGSGSRRTGMHIGHDARALTRRAHGSSYPARSTVSNHFCHGLLGI
jgi:hypothetical protein